MRLKQFKAAERMSSTNWLVAPIQCLIHCPEITNIIEKRELMESFGLNHFVVKVKQLMDNWDDETVEETAKFLIDNVAQIRFSKWKATDFLGTYLTSLKLKHLGTTNFGTNQNGRFDKIGFLVEKTTVCSENHIEKFLEPIVLSVMHKNLTMSLRSFFAKETTSECTCEDANKCKAHFCMTCADHVAARTTKELLSAPEVFIFELAIRDYEKRCGKITKVKSLFKIFFQFLIRKHLFKSQLEIAKSFYTSLQEPLNSMDFLTESETGLGFNHSSYELFAILIHEGPDVENGYYTSKLQLGLILRSSLQRSNNKGCCKNLNDSEWSLFRDGMVYCLAEPISCLKPNLMLTRPNVLFYRRKKGNF
jgi:hypothetical protein